jgi:hypothetical protein
VGEDRRKRSRKERRREVDQSRSLIGLSARWMRRTRRVEMRGYTASRTPNQQPAARTAEQLLPCPALPYPTLPCLAAGSDQAWTGASTVEVAVCIVSIATSPPVTAPSTRRLHPPCHARQRKEKGELGPSMPARYSAWPDDRQASTHSPMASGSRPRLFRHGRPLRRRFPNCLTVVCTTLLLAAGH